MKSKILTSYLVISGLILTLVGSLTAFNSVAVKTEEGIDIAGNPSALNDVRAFGMLILATALLSLVGAFKSTLKRSASLAVVLFFLSVATGRVMSMILDGMPSSGMINATVVELVLGLLGLVLVIINQNKFNK